MRIFLLVGVFLITMCAAAPFPHESVYIPDLTNKVCAQYDITNLDQILFQHVADLDLLAGGPCDHMVGFERHGFKKVQNWIRDQIKSTK